MLTPDLVQAIIDQHQLNGKRSIHFVDHWARVMENGRRLAGFNQARLDVVELFAVFHDSGRVSDGNDRSHGEVGAQIACSMYELGMFQLDSDGLDLLTLACVQHSWGGTVANITVQTCWDSDRLDLLRAGISPDPKRLCTLAARSPEMIGWGNRRALDRAKPKDIYAEWGLPLP